MGYAVEIPEIPELVGAQTKSDLLTSLLGPGQFHTPTLSPCSIRTGQLCVGEIRWCVGQGQALPGNGLQSSPAPTPYSRLITLISATLPRCFPPPGMLTSYKALL